MKEIILEKAFSLFIEKRFNGVSMNQIQTEAKVSRGAIYHHFKSKESIYAEVINKYLIRALSVVTRIAENQKTSLYKAILAAIDERKQIIHEMRSISTTPITDLNYFKLIYDACDFYEGFTTKITIINNREIEEWKKIIQNAIDNNEINPDSDIDFVANNFVFMPQAIGMKYSFSGNINIEELRAMYPRFYELLKI